MLCKRIIQAEELTRTNTGLRLNIAINYGGRWDVTQACRQIADRVRASELEPDAITPGPRGPIPVAVGTAAPDLFVRTGGEMRVSNFLIWHLAYTELYFTTPSGRISTVVRSMRHWTPTLAASVDSAAPPSKSFRHKQAESVPVFETRRRGL